MAEEMQEAESDKMRPNIRIEIHNNLHLSKNTTEAMDVDGTEEGEIIDEISIENPVIENAMRQANFEVEPMQKDIFTTGIDIFDQQAQDKLHERAKRFALKPEEIRTFADSDLQELYDSLGITDETKNNIRFNALNIYGINDMEPEDILEYFAKYAPIQVEWVDSISCNITWPENISAARAIFYTSRSVRGMPVREPVDTSVREFLEEVEETDTQNGKSILLKNREVQLRVDDIAPKINLKHAVDISEVTIPVPPGYWRLGDKHPKAKCLLLRFALKSDLKPYKTENLSRYYKILGYPRKVPMDHLNKSIFDRNKELDRDKNPWGSLAKNWDKDKFREPERNERRLKIKNPSLLHRLGLPELQQVSDDDVEIIEPQSDTKLGIKSCILTKKLPRMRMYADEEEEKFKRKKFLQTIKKQTEKLMNNSDLRVSRPRDLRNTLGMANRFADDVISVDSENEMTDLGTKLKNRRKQMFFTIERHDIASSKPDAHKQTESNIRFLLKNNLAQISPRRPERRHRSRSPIRPPEPRLSLSRKRRSNYKSPERTLHSDRMYSRRAEKRRHRDDSDNEELKQKPRSRVAVVVRKPKKPTVASTIWSRVQYTDSSSSESYEYSRSEESSSSSSSSGSSSSEDSESDSHSQDSDESPSRKQIQSQRPGFHKQSSSLRRKPDGSSIQISMSNDRYKR